LPDILDNLVTEPLLRDYLLGLKSPEDLEKPDPNSDGKLRAYWRMVEAIEEGAFQIEAKHLVSICDDVLSGRLKLSSLEIISSRLIASDYFTWEGALKADIISAVLYEWNGPEINYSLTIRNVKEWKRYLTEGEREMHL
jgi:hypothetical protein